MELDRELLDRYVDGELSPDENARVGQLLARYPAWDGYVRQQENLKQMLRAALPSLGDAMPDRLIKTVNQAPVSWRWRLRAAFGEGFAPVRLAPIGAALAAGLAIGLLLQPGASFTADRSGRILARGGLGEALDNQLASSQSDAAAVKIGISFRNKDGRDCRSFSSGATAGLACHGDGGWMIEGLTRHDTEDAGAAYGMAGSGMPDAVRRAVNTGIQGAPFDAAQEARAKAGGWRGD